MKTSRLVFAAILLFFAGPGLSLAAEAATAVGSLQQVVGKVTIQKAAEKKPAAAVSGMPLHIGDKIRTGIDGKARLVLVDGSELFLAEATRLHLTRFVLEELTRDVKADLLEGTVRAVVSKGKGNFTVDTGNSVAGVRGTDFIASTRDQASFYFQNSGSIAVSSADTTVDLEADTMTLNYHGRAPVPAQSLKEKENLAAVREQLAELTSTEIPPSLQNRENIREILARWNINFASYLVDTGQYYHAESVLLIAGEISGDPTIKSDSLMHLANIQARFLKNMAAAFSSYDALINRFPQSSHYEVALFNAALVLQEMPETEKSLAYFKRYLEEFPRGIYHQVVKDYLQE